jgi:hypothetical protein
MLLGVSTAAAQEKLPAPGGATLGGAPGTAPAPVHGAISATPHYNYQPTYCQPEHGGHGGLGGGIYVLGEAVFVKARSDSFDALLTQDLNGNATLQTFEFDHEITPRITIGWSNCDGMGLRFRWFHYEDDSTVIANIVNPEQGPFGGEVQIVTVARVDRTIDQSDQEFFADVFSNTDGNTVATRTTLRIRVYDLEATQSLELGSASLILSAGIRIIDNESTLEAGEFAGTVFVEDGYRVRFDQWGYGPTISLEGRMCMGAITAFVGVRTSYLLSETDVIVESVDDQNYASSRDDGLFVAEATLGVEWSYDCCYGRIFARGAWEVQLWKDAGLATRIGENFNRNSNLYLEGFAFGVGIQK